MEINTVVLNSWPGSITDFNRKNVSAKFSGGYSVDYRRLEFKEPFICVPHRNSVLWLWESWIYLDIPVPSVLRKSSIYAATLIKNKIKLSSYIRKFRMEQLQSHIWLTASSYMGKYLRISSYIRKAFLIKDFATAPLWISLCLRKILFSFYQCRHAVSW
jgi:hypothetical protein